MRKIEGLSIGLQLDDIEVRQGLTGLKRHLTTVNAEMKANMSAFDRSEKSVQKYETRLEGLNKKLEVQRRVTEQARKQYEKMREENKLGTVEGEKAAREYHNQAAALNNLERYIDKTTKELEKLRKEQVFQESAWGRMTTNLDQFSQKMNNVGEGLTGVGRNMSMKVTAPIMGVGAAALTAGMNFEEGMSKVRALSGSTADEMAELEKMAKHLGETTKFSATDAADGMAFLAMAGYNSNQILDSMPGLLSLAAAGQMELGNAADITTNIMSSFGIEASKTARVADVLAKASASANTDVSQMGEAIKYLGPVANSLGWELEESAAAVMSLSNAGIQGGMAGQAFASSLSRLTKEGGAAGDIIEELGIQLFDAEDNLKSLPEVIAELEKGLEGMSAKQRAATLTTLFGTEAYKHWAILLEEGSEALASNTEMLKNAEGAASEMADIMSDNAKGAVDELKSALEGAGIAIAEHIIPPFVDLVKSGTELVRKFGELDEGTKKNIIRFAAFAAAIGPVSLILGSTFKTVGMLTGGLSKLTGWVGRLAVGGGAATKTLGAVGAAAKTSGVSVGGLGKSVTTVGKGLPKMTGLLGKAGGAIKGVGGIARVAGGALKFLGGPIGLLASIAIPGLIKGGTKLVKHLKESSIPALEDFGDEVSESTTKAVLAYKDLNDEATVQLNQLAWSGKEITGQIAEELTGKFSEMGNQIKTSLKEDFDASHQAMSEFFANSKSLSEEEQQEILENMKTKHEEQQAEIDKHEARIKEIMEKASEEKRALTREEKEEINRIQQEMMETAVQTMSDGEVEQKAILERLKQESGNITAEQAAETVKNSLEAKEGAIKEANEQYDDVVKWAIRERDETGSITAEQADKIIKEAEKQRDESVKKAEEMHKGVVKQAKKQADGQVDNIDWATGEILSNWDKMVRGVAKAVNGVTGAINWVLDKIGVDKKIPEWKPKGYAVGTPESGHPGGPAIVGEVGPELAYIPNQGVTLLGTRGPELHADLPRGTAVLPNKETRQLLKYGFPGYKDGIGDFIKLALNPSALLKMLWDKFLPTISFGGHFKDIFTGSVSYLKGRAGKYIREQVREFLASMKDGIKDIFEGIADGLSRVTGFASGGVVTKDGFYRLAEEGWPEFIIPTAPHRRTEAMKLLALAGKEIGTGSTNTTNMVNKSKKESTTVNNSFNFEGLLSGATIVIREEADIERLARELQKLIKSSARREGVIM